MLQSSNGDQQLQLPARQPHRTKTAAADVDRVRANLRQGALKDSVVAWLLVEGKLPEHSSTISGGGGSSSSNCPMGPSHNSTQALQAIDLSNKSTQLYDDTVSRYSPSVESDKGLEYIGGSDVARAQHVFDSTTGGKVADSFRTLKNGNSTEGSRSATSFTNGSSSVTSLHRLLSRSASVPVGISPASGSTRTTTSSVSSTFRARKCQKERTGRLRNKPEIVDAVDGGGDTSKSAAVKERASDSPNCNSETASNVDGVSHDERNCLTATGVAPACKRIRLGSLVLSSVDVTTNGDDVKPTVVEYDSAAAEDEFSDERCENTSRHVGTQCNWSAEFGRCGDDIIAETGGSMWCRHCGIAFTDFVLYSIHMGCHSLHDPFTCNVCGQRCQHKYSFYTHIMRGHHQHSDR